MIVFLNHETRGLRTTFSSSVNSSGSAISIGGIGATLLIQLLPASLLLKAHDRMLAPNKGDVGR